MNTSATYEQRVKHMAANPYFALASAEHPKVLTLLAKRTDAEGRFECVNGSWNGRFVDGSVTFETCDGAVDMVLVWEGEWPAGCSGYNAAMDLIKGTLA